MSASRTRFVCLKALSTGRVFDSILTVWDAQGQATYHCRALGSAAVFPHGGSAEAIAWISTPRCSAASATVRVMGPT
jgi:hypothetical protein